MENEQTYEIGSTAGIADICDYEEPINYNMDFETECSYSVNTETTRHQKPTSEFKKMDKNFNSVNQKVNKKVVKIEFYDTNISMGTTIRNAVTGEHQRGYKTGSLSENLFFKVIHACAENKNKEPKMLFYDTPEQWEKHFYMKCPQYVKDEWRTKQTQSLDVLRRKKRNTRQSFVTVH